MLDGLRDKMTDCVLSGDPKKNGKAVFREHYEDIRPLVPKDL